MTTTATRRDPYNYEEPEDYAVRKQLGLREIFYPVGAPAVSPPCPPWCHLADEDGWSHTPTSSRPFVAQHVSDDITIALSQYPGEEHTVTDEDGETVRGVGVATLSATIYQDHNSTEPAISLRHTNGTQVLTLSLDDASDLVTVLNYLVAKAEAGAAMGAGQ